MALPDGAAAVFAVATRVSTLDANGFVDAGAQTYVTDTLIKATLAPTFDTGDDIFLKNAAGNGGVAARHGDMVKYGAVTMELATPDPQLEAICAGGVVYNDVTTALGIPTGLTVTPQTTLGSLPAATYGYRATQYNSYGESPATNEVSAVTTGSTGANVISGVVMGATAFGVRVYGRILGVEALLGQYINIGTQATSAASGTASPTTLTVTATTKPIPAGYTFTIAGDANTTKIVFTTTAFAPVGTTTLQVSVSQAITTTIAAGNIVPVFVDTGVITPTTGFPTVDTTAGPGPVGYQAPALGIVPTTAVNGVSIEFFMKAYQLGYVAPTLPYYRIICPAVKNLVRDSADVANANFQTVLKGQGFQNPNWGSGPFGDFPFDSTKWMQRVRCASTVVPLPTVAGVPLSVLASV